jgi:hypothetical protein
VDLRDQLSFLHEATAGIGAVPDMAAIAERFAAALVPRLADSASVHLLDALFVDGAPAPATSQDAAESPVRQIAPAVGGAVLRSMPAADACREAMATAAPVCRPGTEPGGRARLAVPLVARGRVLGCVTLDRWPERPAFDEVDVLTVGQLAAHAALGVDNARLRRGLVRATAGPESAGKRAEPPTLTGIETAHRLLPDDPAAEAAGDWLDSIALPGSRVALVIGDVLGCAARSAAVRDHLRIAVQTLAALDLPPDQLLRQLDNLAQRLGDDHLATCLYMVYDPIARCCVFANAGHLPPILARADGRVDRVEIPTGAPIGVGGVAFETAEVSIRDGDTLIAYTDGLIRANRDRAGDIDERIAALSDRIGLFDVTGRGPEALCDALANVWSDTTADGNDAAVLAARLSGIPTESIAYWLLAPRPATVAGARRLIRQTLDDWGLFELGDMVELLATELITNAIRYASRPIELRLLRTRTLMCEVRDDDLYLPILRQAGELDEDGRGLFLVSRLSRRWGVSRTTHGKVVWFELALNP